MGALRVAIKLFALCLTCAGVFGQPTVFANTNNASEPLVRFINDHQAELKALNSQRRTKEPGMATTEGSAPPLGQILTTFSSNNDPNTIRKLLHRLVDLDLALRTNKFNEVDIRNPLVVRCLVLGLNHSDGAVRSLAMWYITGQTKPLYLRSQVEHLIATPSNLSDPHLIRLLGVLSDTIEARRVLEKLSREQTNFPQEIKARLGDANIERQMIKSFLETTNATQKGEMALKLGYVGTPASIYALARAMRDPGEVRSGYDSYSVRYKILQGLGQALPVEKLFNEDLVSVVQKTIYGSKAGGEDYIDQVEKWCETTFDIKWKNPRPPFFLKVQTPMP